MSEKSSDLGFGIFIGVCCTLIVIVVLSLLMDSAYDRGKKACTEQTEQTEQHDDR